MLSDEEKRELLADAKDPQRRKAFAQARSKATAPMSWGKYFQFLKSMQGLFGFEPKPHKITGEHFKL